MTITPTHSAIAAKIDARMQLLIRAGHDDMTILAEMIDCMPDFKRLMTISAPGTMDELGSRYTGFYRYAKILESLAQDIESGAIKVPKD